MVWTGSISIGDDMKAPQLFMFMTEGMSLARWRDLGMLNRELALYRRLVPQLAGVVIVSYGGREDERLIRDFPGISLICNRWGLPQRLYRRILPLLVARIMRGPALFKSNQVRGAELALRLARRCSAAFLARCGYLFSDFQAHAHGEGSDEHRSAQQLERQVFRAADHCVVTTEAMRVQLHAYGVKADAVSVIPNYVDTNAFAPSEASGVGGRRVVFIGRLEEQKNPLALIQALQGLDVKLDMVGEGSLHAAIAAEAKRLAVQVHFHGNLPHLQLPSIIRAGALFVLPSRYEGHPKTLLEAMACGAAVVGTRVPGIQEVIQHGDTGLLCDPSVEELRTAVVRLLADDGLRAALGKAAREFVLAQTDLDRIIEQELLVYQRAMASHHKSSGARERCQE